MRPYSIINAGVGGQGVVRMSNILGEACALTGTEVRSGELHGLSQRSGSIVIHLRIGEGSVSPLVPYGEADVILALEPMEALRYLYYLKPGGLVITNTDMVHPPGETEDLVRGKIERYITYDEVIDAIKEEAAVVEIDALDIANEAGNPLTVNVVMVGALAVSEGFPLDRGAVVEAVRSTVPPVAVDVNLRAFDLGAEAFRLRSE